MPLDSGEEQLAFFGSLFNALRIEEVASVLPNSLSADTAIVNGTTLALRMRLRDSGSTKGRIALKTATAREQR